MASKQFNSVDGYSVGSTPISIIDANANITAVALTANGNASFTGANVSLGAVGNLKITGGSSGFYLQTDGSGNLSWQTVTVSAASISNGNSNVNIPSANGNIQVSVAGVANVITFANNNAYRGSYGLTGAIFQANTAPASPQPGDQWYNTFNGILFEYIDDGTSSQWVDVNGLPGVVGPIILPGGTANAVVYLSSTGETISSSSFVFDGTNVTAPRFTSTVATGTAPLTVSSTTLVSNLNADLLDGYNTATANTANTVAVRDASGNVAANYFIGNGSQLTGIITSVSNVSNGTSNLDIPAADGNINMSVAGNANVLVVTGNGIVTGSGSGGNISGVNVISANTAILATAANIPLINSGNSNITLTPNANISLYVTGNATARLVATSTGVNVAGTLNATGNANVGNIGATNANVTAITATGNANVGNLGTARVIATGNISGTQLISNVATGTAPLVVASTTRVTNLNADLLGGLTTDTAGTNGTIVARTGNGQVIGNTLLSSIATGTAPLVVTSTTRVANLNVAYANVADFISVVAGTGNNFLIFANAATGNITELTSTGLIANLSNNSITATTFVGALSGAATSATTAGTVTTAAQPNITSVGTLSSVSVTGNVDAGNLTTTGVLSVTGTGVSSIAGNLDMTSNTIINLATPTNPTDAATKQYVDDIAQGLHTHDSCNAATNTTLATISGGTVTYDNGASGVGANLTTTGSFTTIDGVTLSNGMRILVKNEANSAHNGIYDRTSSTVLTRSSDFDTPTEMAGGDFTFVTAGTLYDNTGWVMVDVVTTVGTSPVDWVQFSGAGTYTAGTGLTLTGTSFSVNASQTQVTAVGTLTGLNSSGTITAPAFTANTGVFTGNGSGLSAIAGANVTGTVANATYATSAGSATSATTAGTVTTAAQPNITSVGTLSSLSVTGNVTGGNLNTSGNVNASIMVDGGTGIYLAAGPSGYINFFTTGGDKATITDSGNIAASNLIANSTVFATTSNVSGNVNAGNVYANSGTIGASLLTGTLTTAAQPNITSTGTLTSLTVSGGANLASSSGNVGIGTTSPTVKLEVLVADGAEATKLRGATGRMRIRPYVDATNGSFIDAVNTAENAYIPLSLAGSSIRLTTNGGLAATVDSGGNVGIGTASPEAHLTVSGGAGSATGAMISIFETSTGNDARLRIVQDVGAAYYDATYGSGSNQHIWKIGGTERMRLNASGNVGIGTTSPATTLHAQKDSAGGTTYAIYTDNGSAGSGTNVAGIGFANGGAMKSSITAAVYNNDFLAFNVGGSGTTERMRIDASGNLGIGTTGPTYRLDIASADTTAGLGYAMRIRANATAAGGTLQFTDDGATAQWGYLAATATSVTLDASGSSVLAFRTNGNERMRIDSSGNVGIGTSSPAQKLSVNGNIVTAGEVALSGADFVYSWAGGTTGQRRAGFYLDGSNQVIRVYTAQNEVARFDASGNVGIGNSNPSGYGGRLTIGDPADTFSNNLLLLTRYATATLIADGVTAANGAQLDVSWATGGQGPLRFTFTSTERMRLTSGGNLGIGTTAPTYKLEVYGSPAWIRNFAGTPSSPTETQDWPVSAVNIASFGDFTLQTMLAFTLPNDGNYFTDYSVWNFKLDQTASSTTSSGVSGMQFGGPGYLAFMPGGSERFRILSTGGITSSAAADAVGYKGLPQNSQTASYTLALTDMGKHISITTGGVVIPANGSVAFPIGSTIVVFNNSGSNQTISITTDTLRLAGTATTGSRTLAQYGLATLVKVTSTVWVATGNVT